MINMYYILLNLISITVFSIIYWLRSSEHNYMNCLYISASTQISLGTSELDKTPILRPLVMFQLLSVMIITSTYIAKMR
jgi:hypothetical protein